MRRLHLNHEFVCGSRRLRLIDENFDQDQSDESEWWGGGGMFYEVRRQTVSAPRHAAHFMKPFMESFQT